MKKYAIIAISFLAFSCNQGDEAEAKRKQLEQYKKEAATLANKISKLEAELENGGKPVEFLVSVGLDTLQYKDFTSLSDFQATVESEHNVLLSTENGGVVTEIPVKEGQMVAAGQVLVKLDASLIETQIAEISNALELAENLYGKQKRLREQNIGTEMQFLEAKNRYESLQKQMQSAQVRLAKSQVRAPFSGKIDRIVTSIGALTAPGTPLLRLVDGSNIKIVAQVPESYIGTIKKGDKVQVRYPSLNKTVTETVDAVSEAINTDNRTFHVFIRPQSKEIALKPNLLAIVSATDFRADSVLTVPTQVIKRDAANNPFVFVVTNKENTLSVEKRALEIGKYGADFSIVTEGLNQGDLLITKGYNSVDEGDRVKVIN